MSDSPRDLTAPTNSPLGIRFFVGLAILICGYSSALVGSITILRISLDLTLGMTLGGMFLANALPKFFDKRLGLPEFGRGSRVAMVAGMIFVAATLMFFERITNINAWYFHPAGFQLTWVLLIGAVVHYRHLYQQFARPKDNVVPVGRSYEPAETLETNPYAPPRS